MRCRPSLCGASPATLPGDSPLSAGPSPAAAAAASPPPNRGRLRRAAAFTPAVKHALAAFVVSAGARPEDASGGVPANFSQMRQGCLSALRDRAELAKGGRMQREMSAAVYKSTANAAEGILAGEVDVAQLVKLFGGVSPAQTLYTMGSAGQGRDGSTSSKHDIEKALRWWAGSFDAVLGPLLQCPKGPEGDFGLGDFLREAEHVDAPRLLRACEETFRLISRQFQNYRTSFDAPPPDPQRALSDAIVSAIRPLAHEQNTAAIAREAVAAKQGAAGKDDGAKAQKLIDAQGAELLVLAGASKTLASVQVLLLELAVVQYNLGAPIFFEVHAAAERLGFRAFDVSELHYTNAILIQIDIMFVRKTSRLWDRATTGYEPPPV